MGKTLDVATDRAGDPTKTVVPNELARASYVTNAPSLRALKLLHVMITTAAGALAEDRDHATRLATIRAAEGMNHHHDRASLTPLFEELAAVVITTDDTERQIVTIGGIVDEARIDYRDEPGGDLAITWRFRASFRRMAEQSNYWTILDRQTLFHMQSKYSVLLFQYISSFENYDHIHRESLTIRQLRALLGITEGKVKRFADIRTKVLIPAIAEINQLSRLVLAYELEKTGKTVTKVTLTWQAKADPEPAMRETAASKVGRRHRRDGTAEMLVKPPFPATGGIAFEPYWQAIKRKAGCNMDDAMVAEKFRAWCKAKGIRLDAHGIADNFAAFCAKVGRL